MDILPLLMIITGIFGLSTYIRARLKQAKSQNDSELQESISLQKYGLKILLIIGIWALFKYIIL